MSDDPGQSVRRVVDETRALAGGSRKAFGLLLEAQALRAELFGRTERARRLREALTASG